MDDDDRLLASRLAERKNQNLQSAHESLGSFKRDKGTEENREFYCQICLERCAISRGHTLNCGHTYCRGCLFRYLEVKIRDGVTQPKCFHPLRYKNHCRGISRERRDENEDENAHESYHPRLHQSHDMKTSNLQGKESNNNGANDQIDRNFKLDFVFDGKTKVENTSTEEDSVEEIDCGTLRGASSRSILDIIPERNSLYGLDVLELHSSRAESSSTLDQSSMSMDIDQSDGRKMIIESEVDVEEWNRHRGISINPESKFYLISNNGNIEDDKDTVDNDNHDINDKNNNSIIYDEHNDFDSKDNDANNSFKNSLSSDSTLSLCDAIISTKDILSIISISSDLAKKFEFFKFTKENIDGRECPTCSNLQICSPLKPSIICENCGDVYCFFHSKAHPNMSCEEVSFCLILITL